MRIGKTCGATLALAASLAMSGAAQAALHDRGGGLIYDDVLNVTWLQDANYARTSGYDGDGVLNWEQAVTWAASLNYYDSVRNVTYSDWRLPTVGPVNGTSFILTHNSSVGATDIGVNIGAPGTIYAGSTGSEMAYMFYQSLGNPGYFTPSGAISGCFVSYLDTCLNNAGPFVNLEGGYYWSGTEYPGSTSNAFIFGFGWSDQFSYVKSGGSYAWAVRDGDVAAVPEADTWVMILAGLALVGAAARRRTQCAQAE